MPKIRAQTSKEDFKDLPDSHEPPPTDSDGDDGDNEDAGSRALALRDEILRVPIPSPSTVPNVEAVVHAEALPERGEVSYDSPNDPPLANDSFGVIDIDADYAEQECLFGLKKKLEEAREKVERFRSQHVTSSLTLVPGIADSAGGPSEPLIPVGEPKGCESMDDANASRAKALKDKIAQLKEKLSVGLLVLNFLNIALLSL